MTHQPGGPQPHSQCVQVSAKSSSNGHLHLTSSSWANSGPTAELAIGTLELLPWQTMPCKVTAVMHMQQGALWKSSSDLRMEIWSLSLQRARARYIASPQTFSSAHYLWGRRRTVSTFTCKSPLPCMTPNNVLQINLDLGTQDASSWCGLATNRDARVALFPLT